MVQNLKTLNIKKDKLERGRCFCLDVPACIGTLRKIRYWRLKQITDR